LEVEKMSKITNYSITLPEKETNELRKKLKEEGKTFSGFIRTKIKEELKGAKA
jgi:hypothetical protein